MAEVAGAERRAEGSAPARREQVPSDAGRMATTTGPGGVAVTPSLGQLAVQAKSTVGATTDPQEREADRRLIAHELTHVVQQTGRAEAPIRRQPAKDKKKPAVDNLATPPRGPVFENPTVGKIDTTAQKGEIASLTIPPFKKDLIDNL